MIQDFHSSFVLWLGGRFLGTGVRNVMVVMLVVILVTFYFTGWYDKIVGKKQNKGF